MKMSESPHSQSQLDLWPRGGATSPVFPPCAVTLCRVSDVSVLP